MKTLKLIFGILLITAGIGSLLSFSQAVDNYDMPELIGHLITTSIVFILAFFLIKSKKMKYIILLLITITACQSNAQCDIKTTNRPDGITIKYFNPKPVIRSKNYEVGIAIYKNENSNDYFINLSVLFLKTSPADLRGDLVIQTEGEYGLKLDIVLSKQINMNGNNLTNAMFRLEYRDIMELKKYKLKSLFFNLDSNLEGSTVTENKDILINELNCIL